MRSITLVMLMVALLSAGPAMAVTVTFDASGLVSGKDDGSLGLGLFTATGNGLKGNVWEEKGVLTREMVLDEWVYVGVMGSPLGYFKVIQGDSGYQVEYRSDTEDRMTNNFTYRFVGDQLTMTLQTQRLDLRMNGYQGGWFMPNLSYQNAGDWVFYVPMDFSGVAFESPGSRFSISMTPSGVLTVDSLPATGALLIGGQNEMYFDGMVNLSIHDNNIPGLALGGGHFGWSDTIGLGDSEMMLLPGTYQLFSWPVTGGDQTGWFINGVNTDKVVIPATFAPDWGLEITYVHPTSGATYSMTFSNPVPEPATIGLLALGGLALWRRRR